MCLLRGCFLSLAVACVIGQRFLQTATTPSGNTAALSTGTYRQDAVNALQDLVGLENEDSDDADDDEEVATQTNSDDKDEEGNGQSMADVFKALQEDDSDERAPGAGSFLQSKAHPVSTQLLQDDDEDEDDDEEDDDEDAEDAEDRVDGSSEKLATQPEAQEIESELDDDDDTGYDLKGAVNALAGVMRADDEELKDDMDLTNMEYEAANEMRRQKSAESEEDVLEVLSSAHDALAERGSDLTAIEDQALMQEDGDEANLDLAPKHAEDKESLEDEDDDDDLEKALNDLQ